MSTGETRPRTRAERIARRLGQALQIVVLALAVFYATYRIVRGGEEAATFRYEGF